MRKPAFRAISSALLLVGLGGVQGYAAPVEVTGFLRFETWVGMDAGTAVTLLTDYANYPAKPDLTAYTPAFDSRPVYADDSHEQYGARLSGWLNVAETADYDFFIRSDDASEFYISSDDKEANLSLAAQQTGCCNAFTEPGGGDFTTASPIRLVAGRKYYVQMLYKEGGGGDYGQVAWRKTTDTTAAASLLPIPGKFLSCMAEIAGSKLDITTPPASVTVVDGKTTTFSVSIDSFSPLTTLVGYQWIKNGKDIDGATKAKYTTTALALAADQGAKFSVRVTIPGVAKTSAEAVVTMIADTFPPVVQSVGAIVNPDKTFDIGIEFDEPVEQTSAALQANYSISGGAVTAFKYYPKSPGAVLTVSGLTAGSKYTVTVKNVADVKGNKITTTTKDFTVGKVAWGVVGGDRLKLGNGVVAVGDNGFDVYSDGATEWNNYDEATFVYEQITGNFDKVLQVEYQDSSSQWARAGLIARDVTNFGVNDAEQFGSQPEGNSGVAPFDGKAARYQKIHVNPTTTVMGTAGNNAWEGNRRLVTGGPSSSAFTGNNAAPQYPNAWVRLSRDGQTFTIWRSEDGQNWTWNGSTSWYDDSFLETPTGLKPMPDTMYVGPDYSPENGNISDETLRGMWLAKFRNYGDSKATASFDKVGSAKGYLMGTAKFSDDKGGFTGQAGDYAIDFGKAGSSQCVYIPDGSLLNKAAAKDEMSFAIWVKKYDIANSSVFWCVSPSSSGTTRGWQAHTPWSDNNIYFDTAGCCTADTQRISANISTFDGYTAVGNNDFWTNWHHFVFTKKADAKNIYIDGKLFLAGTGADPLPKDFTVFYLGGFPTDGNMMHGLVDDFAIYSKELTPANVAALAAKTSAPKDLTSAGLLAYWDFNDIPAPTTPSKRTYGVGLNFGAGFIAGSTLAATDVAGVPSVAQANWNNVSGPLGTTNKISADAAGAAKDTAVSVTWTSAGVWSSTGSGEENNKFTGADKALLAGYLDTGAATTTGVTITGIPDELTSGGYDVYVYAMGGVAGGRSGGYRILDANSKAVIKDYVIATSSSNATSYAQVPLSTDPAKPGVGNYIVFSGIGSANIIVEATTANGKGGSSTPRAPINAIQLVAPATSAPAPMLSAARTATGLSISYSGTLLSAPAVSGPWTPVAGAASPYAAAAGSGQMFFKASK